VNFQKHRLLQRNVCDLVSLCQLVTYISSQKFLVSKIHIFSSLWIIFTKITFALLTKWRQLPFYRVISDRFKNLYIFHSKRPFPKLPCTLPFNISTEFAGNKTSWSLGPKCDCKACMDCLAGQKLNWRLNQVLVLSQIATKETLILVKMVRHFPSCHIRYRCDFKMAALSSQTIHNILLISIRF
jgi:hypothetical protein